VKGTQDVVAIKKYKESDEGGDSQASLSLLFLKHYLSSLVHLTNKSTHHYSNTTGTQDCYA
jgi:hypothetical protein